MQTSPRGGVFYLHIVFGPYFLVGFLLYYLRFNKIMV